MADGAEVSAAEGQWVSGTTDVPAGRHPLPGVSAGHRSHQPTTHCTV